MTHQLAVEYDFSLQPKYNFKILRKAPPLISFSAED